LKLALFALAALAARAEWAEVRSVAPDHKIEVALRTGAPARGLFVSADDLAIVVREKSGERSIARGDIRTVRVADSSRRTRNTILGAAIGAGAGLAIGFAVCPGCANEGSAGKFTGPGAAAGAGAGALAGLLPVPYRTIYKAN
jgi:hypothetical protein